MQWVSVADMPEGWKDGRDLLFTYTWRNGEIESFAAGRFNVKLNRFISGTGTITPKRVMQAPPFLTTPPALGKPEE